MTFGCFDLCHQGHVNLLRAAKARCEKLVVCVSSDDYIYLKKKHRPLLNLKDRMNLVRLTGLADVVTVQNIFGKMSMILYYEPDLLFVGDDWDAETYDGATLGKVVYLPHTKGISTTWYRNRLSPQQ